MIGYEKFLRNVSGGVSGRDGPSVIVITRLAAGLTGCHYLLLMSPLFLVEELWAFLPYLNQLTTLGYKMVFLYTIRWG